MMTYTKPSRYYVELPPQAEDDREGPIHNVNTERQARAYWREHGGRIIERIEIRDDTPADLVPGTVWDWYEIVIEDWS